MFSTINSGLSDLWVLVILRSRSRGLRWWGCRWSSYPSHLPRFSCSLLSCSLATVACAVPVSNQALYTASCTVVVPCTFLVAAGNQRGVVYSGLSFLRCGGSQRNLLPFLLVIRHETVSCLDHLFRWSSPVLMLSHPSIVPRTSSIFLLPAILLTSGVVVAKSSWQEDKQPVLSATCFVDINAFDTHSRYTKTPGTRSSRRGVTSLNELSQLGGTQPGVPAKCCGFVFQGVVRASRCRHLSHLRSWSPRLPDFQQSRSPTAVSTSFSPDQSHHGPTWEPSRTSLTQRCLFCAKGSSLFFWWWWRKFLGNTCISWHVWWKSQQSMIKKRFNIMVLRWKMRCEQSLFFFWATRKRWLWYWYWHLISVFASCPREFSVCVPVEIGIKHAFSLLVRTRFVFLLLGMGIHRVFPHFGLSAATSPEGPCVVHVFGAPAKLQPTSFPRRVVPAACSGGARRSARRNAKFPHCPRAWSGSGAGWQQACVLQVLSSIFSNEMLRQSHHTTPHTAQQTPHTGHKALHTAHNAHHTAHNAHNELHTAHDAHHTEHTTDLRLPQLLKQRGFHTLLWRSKW